MTSTITVMLIYFLLTRTVSFMKTNQKMFMKKFLNTNICLTSEIVQKFYDHHNEMVFGEMKDEYKGISINKFVGLN